MVRMPQRYGQVRVLLWQCVIFKFDSKHANQYLDLIAISLKKSFRGAADDREIAFLCVCHGAVKSRSDSHWQAIERFDRAFYNLLQERRCTKTAWHETCK